MIFLLQGKLEQVSSIGRDRNYDNIVIGDTAGHIRVWDISRGINTSSAEACRGSFVQASLLMKTTQPKDMKEVDDLHEGVCGSA
jgi:hypothetical protein